MSGAARDLPLPDRAAVAARTRAWIVDAALPLWSSAGFDRAQASFIEALDLERRPLPDLPRRLMVQARQLAVFADAALEGHFPAGAEIAHAAGHAMIARYLAADGAPGWIFSATADGRIVDPARDLYAHAFALFGLAALRRLEASATVEAAIAATLDVLDRAFFDPLHGGYWDALPRRDRLRRQNPHMHLFEALLALHAATGDPGILARCAGLDRLARRAFLNPQGALVEEFSDDWTVHPASGAGRLEAGHQFEWAWLFRWYEAASGENRDAVVAGLLASALRCGVDPSSGRICDAALEDGTLVQASSRAWPHAEALKSLAVERARGWGAAPLAGLETDLVERIATRLFTLYCPPTLGGGWIDQRDAEDRPQSTRMPASSLYHLYFGFRALQA